MCMYGQTVRRRISESGTMAQVGYFGFKKWCTVPSELARDSGEALILLMVGR